MYVIRQATAEDWPQISAFIDRTYESSAPFKQRERWDWQFRNTPFEAADGDLAPVWIALDGETVVGQLALQPARLWLDGQPFPVGWIVDVMIDAAHRGKGLSHKINDAIVASGRTLVTLTMAPATRKIMERAGCITLPPVRQMVRPERLSGRTISVLLERIAENRAQWRIPIHWFVASRAAPAGLAWALSVGARLGRAPQARKKGLELRNVDGPDAGAVDRLWATLLGKSRAVFDRSAAFHAWRFGQAPDLDYQYAEASGIHGPRATVVWRLPRPIELPVGTLVDVLCDPDDTEALGASIDHAVSAMAGRCEAIIAGASDPRFVAELSKRGFVTVRTHYPTVVSSDSALLDRIAAVKDAWHFSKADHDWDQVHPAEH